MHEIISITSLYNPDDIYNTDESGCLFRMFPKVTYVLPGEKKSARGIKGMQSKDRLTFKVVTNAKGRSLCHLEIEESEVFSSPSSSNALPSAKNAWMDGTCFQVWFHKVFLAHVRHITSTKVLLLMDNARSHMDITDPREQVKLEF